MMPRREKVSLPAFPKTKVKTRRVKLLVGGTREGGRKKGPASGSDKWEERRHEPVTKTDLLGKSHH